MSHAVYQRSPLLTHTVLQVTQNGISEHFLTLLYPQNKVSNTPDISTASVTNGSGIRLAYDDTTDYCSMLTDSAPLILSTDTTDISSDASLLFYQTIQDTTSYYFCLNGTYISSDQNILFSSSPCVI